LGPPNIRNSLYEDHHQYLWMTVIPFIVISRTMDYLITTKMICKGQRNVSHGQYTGIDVKFPISPGEKEEALQEWGKESILQSMAASGFEFGGVHSTLLG
jgi:hypothetical protein